MFEKIRKLASPKQNLAKLDVLVHPWYLDFQNKRVGSSDSRTYGLDYGALWKNRYQSFRDDSEHALLVISSIRGNETNKPTEIHQYTEFQKQVEIELGNRFAILPFEFYEKLGRYSISRFNWKLCSNADISVYGEIFEWCVEGVCRSLTEQMPESKITKIPGLSLTAEQSRKLMISRISL